MSVTEPPNPPFSLSSVCPTVLTTQPPSQYHRAEWGIRVVGVRGYWAEMAFVPFIKSVASLMSHKQQGYNPVTFSRGWCPPTTTTCEETHLSPILPFGWTQLPHQPEAFFLFCIVLKLNILVKNSSIRFCFQVSCTLTNSPSRSCSCAGVITS